MKTTAHTIHEYNVSHSQVINSICSSLQEIIDLTLASASSKIWHGSPVWVIDENPIVAYSVRANGSVSLMFFSGQSLLEDGLTATGKFKAAEITYSSLKDIDHAKITIWLHQAARMQWDYKNIIKNKGELYKLGEW